MADTHTSRLTEPIFREQHQLIIDLFTALNATEPIEEIVRQLALAFAPTIPFTRFRFSLAPWGWFWVVNEDNSVKRHQSKLETGVAYYTVIDTQQSLLRKNVAKEQRSLADKNLLKNGHHSVLIVPICSQNKAIGALHFLHSTPDTYDQVHRHHIETLVPLIASSVEQLCNRLEVETLSRLSQTLRQTGDLNEALDILAFEIVNVSICQNIMIALVENERHTVEVVRRIHTDPRTKKPSQIPREKPIQYDLNDPNITAEVARTGKIEIIEGWDDRFDRSVSDPKKFKDRISYFIPIKNDNQVLAVLATGSLISEKPMMMACIETIHPLLDQMAVAIEHAHLLQKHQKIIQTQKALINMSSAVQKMKRTTDIETMLQVCLQEWIVLGLNICSLAIHHILDADRNLVEIFRVDQKGAMPGSGQRTHRPPIITRWKNRETLYLDNLANKSDRYVNVLRSNQNNHLILSFIDIPFEQGILSVHSTQQKAFSPGDQKILQETADLIAVGFTRLEDLEEKENLARQQEALLSIGATIRQVTRSKQIEEIIRNFHLQLDKLKIRHVTIALHHLVDEASQTFEIYRLNYAQEYVQDNKVKSDIYNIWKNAQTIYRPDLKNDSMDEKEDFYETSPSKYGTYICSSVDIPHALGILAVLSDTPHAFSNSQINFLEQAAEKLCVGITRINDLENLEQKNAQLQTHAAEMERFTYTVSHDLKSPLITIRGYLGHIENNAQQGKLEYVSADLARIDKAASHMGNLLDDLLELSRIGRIDHLPETMSLNDLIQQACDMLAGTIETHQVTIDIESNLPHIFGDRLRLLEVMQNLIENAIKFMDTQPTPHIKIGMQTDTEHPTCYIQDNGIGIDPRYHDKIFGLFDKLSKQSEGTGIGLALVRRILQHHDQKIWVESEGLGKGSTFYFTLPLAKNDIKNKG